MKPSTLRTFVVAAAVTLAGGLTACGSSTDAASSSPAADCQPVAKFDTIVPGTLTVAAVQQLPGIDIDVTTGETTGLDSVLLPKFAEQNCLQIDFQALAGPAAVAAMTEGKADVGGGGWYRTEQRGEVMGQTQPIWYDQVGIVSPSGFASIEELQDKRVGVVGGSLFEKPLAEAIGTGNVVTYQSIDAIFEDIAAGRIDAGMGAGATLTIQVRDRQLDLKVGLLDPDPAYPQLTAPGEPNYPTTKSNTALGQALDAFVGEARSSGLVKDTLAEYGVTSEFAITGPQS